MRKERVLITGGASGIGAAIARRCHEDGLEPVIIDRIGNGLIAHAANPGTGVAVSGLYSMPYVGAVRPG